MNNIIAITIGLFINILRFATADKALRSNYFWSYLRMIIILHGMVNDLGSWAEGCACHGFDKPCILRGRRAPECATGFYEHFVEKTLTLAQSLFCAIAAGLGESSNEWRQLNAEWCIGIDCIRSEVQLKTVHWSKLPWHLCGLAVPEQEKARAVARSAVQMFDSLSNDAMTVFGRRHRISQRFLRRDFAGNGLRDQLDQFILGADLATDPSLKSLREWVGGLRLVRIVERQTEVLWLGGFNSGTCFV